jgi:hypothetical protein
MLEANDVKISSNSPDVKIFEIYDKAVRLLKERFGRHVVLDFPKDNYRVVKTDKNKSIIEHSQGVLFKSVTIYNNNQNQWNIRYFRNEKMLRTGRKGYEPAYIHFADKIAISLDTDPDFAFFMIFVSPLCGAMNGEIGKLQNDKRAGTPQFVVWDEQGDARKEIIDASLASKADAMIVSQDIGLPANKVIDICIAYGLMDPKVKGDEFIARKLLRNYVLHKEHGEYDYKKLQTFIDDCDVPHVTEVKVVVKKAIAFKVVKEIGSGNEMQWAIASDNGEPATMLCRINNYYGAEKSLEVFFNQNENQYNDVKQIISDRVNSPVDVTVPVDDEYEFLGDPVIRRNRKK